MQAGEEIYGWGSGLGAPCGDHIKVSTWGLPLKPRPRQWDQGQDPDKKSQAGCDSDIPQTFTQSSSSHPLGTEGQGRGRAGPKPMDNVGDVSHCRHGQDAHGGIH